jgi:NAD(P)-dependent dehydrogenase (short-subunit alcohol dehydrogenase family)
MDVLVGRAVIVTGGGAGLGRAYARLLARHGAAVVVSDLPEDASDRSSSAIAVAEEIAAAGGNAITSYHDITSVAGARGLVDTALEAFGRVDAVIANAGILRDRTLLKMSPQDFEDVLRVHLLGTVLPVQAALPPMREAGFGRIVVTTSASGLHGNVGQTNYGAAKLGLVGFVQALALEVERHGILANAIAPFASTRMGRAVFSEDEQAVLREDLVAPVGAYLASPACTTTGATIVAGGGVLRRAAMCEGAGVALDPRGPLDLQHVAAVLDDVLRMDDPRPFATAGDALSDLLARARAATPAPGAGGRHEQRRP